MQGVALEFVTTIMQEPAPSTIKLFNINSTQDVRLLAVLGDSWTSKGRFRPEIVDTPRPKLSVNSAIGQESVWCPQSIIS